MNSTPKQMANTNLNSKGHGKNFYNDIGLRLAHKLLGLEYLHYGYFENLPTALSNLPQAQEKYMEVVLGHIPEGVTTILDIGCGAGGMAKNMVLRGYDLTICEPDPYLLNKTQEMTNHMVKGVIGFYQNTNDLPENYFDLILMSESCQYVPFQMGFAQHRRFGKIGGYVLISDFFITKKLDSPFLSKSGHPLDLFLKQAQESGFELIKNIDITPQTAPTMDIYQSLIINKAFPIFEALFEYTQKKYPTLYKLLSYFLSKKINFVRQKYLTQSAEVFSKYKSYRILLFKINPLT